MRQNATPLDSPRWKPELLSGSALANAPVVVVSARTGEGLDQLREAIAALAADVPAKQPGGAARLPIDRAFTMHGFGTVATGTLVSGEVHVGDALELLPRRQEVRVRGVQYTARQRRWPRRRAASPSTSGAFPERWNAA